MITYEQYRDMLEKLTDEFPLSFFEELNLGVTISKELRFHPQSRRNELYIMGEYRVAGAMGRGIVMYYTPFMIIYGEIPEEAAMNELRRIYRHEFRHHLEFLAGEHGLEREDMAEIQEYLDRDE